MDEVARVVLFAVAMVVFIIWRADSLANRLEATEMPGRGSNRGFYFWGALILFACIGAWVLFSRAAAAQ